VRVFDAKDERAAVTPGEKPVEERRTGAADVQVTGRRRRKSNADHGSIVVCCCLPAAGCRLPEARSWKLEAGSWKPEAGSWKPEATYRMIPRKKRISSSTRIRMIVSSSRWPREIETCSTAKR